MRVVVLGGGVAGVTTAWFLARAGHTVTVVERQAEVAEETSHANGGVIGGSQVEPWPAPGLGRKILGWLGKEDAPLLLRYGQIPKMWRWGLAFLRNCNKERFEANMRASLRLTLYSQEVGARLREDAGLDSAEYDHARRGALKVFMSEAAFAEARHLGELLASWGLDVRPVDRDTCAALEPGLAKRAETIAGGLHFPNEETGDCRLFTRAMRHRCEAAGVSFRFGTTVQGLEVASGKVVTVTTDKGRIEPDAVVAALASYSPPLLAKVGLRVPVCPVKGVTVTVPAAPWPDAVRGAVMDHSRLYGFIRIGERLRIAGSAEITGYDTVPAKARCQALIDNALQLFPDFRLCLDAAEPVLWAGVRAVAPDGPPILGPTPIANLFLNTGPGPQGWSTAAGCARLVADLVSGHKPEITTDGLTLARFAA